MSTIPKDKLLSFEELHLFFKDKGLVKEEWETEGVLIMLVFDGFLEKQVFPETNTIWYRRTDKRPPWESEKL